MIFEKTYMIHTFIKTKNPFIIETGFLTAINNYCIINSVFHIFQFPYIGLLP